MSLIQDPATALAANVVDAVTPVFTGKNALAVAISGSVPIAPGAATSALQTSGNASLTSLDGKTPVLGQTTMANSQPVTLASNQTGVPVTDNGGSLTVDGTVGISGTVPVSIAAQPLPAGAATAALQTQPGVDIGDVTINNAAGAAAVNIQDGGNSITVDGTVGISGTVAVSAVALPLPAGAASETTLAALNTKHPAQGQALMVASVPVVIASNQSALAVTLVTAPLPTGAATAALQTQPGVDIGDVTINNATGAAAVNIQDGGNSITVDGTVGISGTVPVSAATLPLPTGAATETTLATRLADSTFTGRINTLGQKAMAASTPVTLASDQSALAVTLATLPLPTGAATAALQTQPGVDIGDVTINNAGAAAAVNIQDGGNSITVDGAVTANIGTTNGLALDATLTGGTQKAVARGGAKGATTAADVTSTNQSVDRQAIDVQIRTSTGVAVDAFGGGIQFADGAARGTATGTLCMGDDGTNIQSINVDTAGRLNINTITGAVTLPTGASTEASLTTRLADATFTGRINTLGQKAMAASTPVTLASDQSALAVTLATAPLPTGAATAALQTQPGVDIGDVTINNAVGAAAVNIQDGGNSITVDGAVSIVGTVPVSAASLPLPTGAATEASLTTRLADATFTGRVNTLGQKAMAASTPVTFASDQSALAITAATLPLPTGAATETTLAALNTKTPALGQALMVVSQPVTIASNQSNLGVVGAAANAAAVTGNPVLVAGSDGTNTRTLSADTLGNLRVNGPVRSRVSITFQAVAPGVADTPLSMVKSINGVPAAAAVSIPVTGGKTLRITNITVSIKAGAAAAAFGTLNLRINPAAAATITSLSEFRVDLGNTEAVIGAARAIAVPIPNGFELTGTTQLACSFSAQAVTNIISVTLTGYEY